ncbi:hypothetical protein [Microbacterium sp. No. 7]|uniref:hypothetical protein n=1 Tax=Microbacterium sp. No. 7 TaxID=1714373 RepID=UPI0006CF86BC|nr:hypothetical protein [Microbacterium sp. No. 7]
MTDTAPAAPPRSTVRRFWPVFAVAGLGALIIAFVVGAASTQGQINEARAEAATATHRITELEEQRDAALDMLNDERARIQEQKEAVNKREEGLTERENAVKAREDAVTAVETQIAQTSLKDGVYTVGVSMEPGTYRTESTSSRCYWKITVAGTNYDDIVQNDLGSVGILTVTISDGQDFHTASCGTWAKIE